MQIAVDTADEPLRILVDGRGRFCLWPCDVSPPGDWRPVLRTADRRRFLDTLVAELPFLTVTLEKNTAPAAARA
ncbi:MULTISPECIES: MbtH family NRPS accessory protein [Streptomyces]|uniref:Uncharacterized protein n=1 Tax=Streptomyces viridochromogenes TaxID=1938 RepID=A0A0L8J9C1_STRVR|nr:MULTISPECIES: MbtH family NRPS accessory protein [Streptomyces]KOG10283.1 hypothetical protein ADK34_35740 [Streptomyces viridochromogenes]